MAEAEKPTEKTDVRMMAIGWIRLSAIEPGRLKMSPLPNLAACAGSIPLSMIARNCDPNFA